MHNFAVNAVICLNLMILDHGQEKNYIYMFVSLEGQSPYDLGESDDLFADIDNFAVYAIFRLNLITLGHRRV
jgi:hypothetical protein